jgi:glycosyltransferase involved in cell wall biosynthesis
VLASDIPELRELVDDGVTGLTFSADDAGALAGALTRLAVMPDGERERIRAQARARHAVAFSTPAMVCNYINLYHLARRARTQRHAVRPSISPAA